MARIKAYRKLEDLGVEEARDEHQPAADLGDDQAGHEGLRPADRAAELVVGVTPPAVERVAGDRGEEVEGKRPGGEQVDQHAPAAQLDEGGDQKQGEAVE